MPVLFAGDPGSEPVRAVSPGWPRSLGGRSIAGCNARENGPSRRYRLRPGGHPGLVGIATLTSFFARFASAASAAQTPCLLALILLTHVAPAAAQAAGEASLEQVVVTGTRTEKTLDDTPTRTEVVTRQELERTGAVTLTDALENLPGVHLSEVHGKSGHSISLQGLTGDQVLVLVDGLPITASTGSTVDLSQLLLVEVDRIEVVKGASSVQYGSAAMGGVVNVITRPIRPGFSGAAAVDVGTRGDQNHSGDSDDLAWRHLRGLLEGGSQQWRWRVAADALHDDGYAVDPSGWSRQGDRIRREQALARLGWHGGNGRTAFIEFERYREADTQRYTQYAPPNYIPQRKTEDIDRDRLTGGIAWLFDGGTRLEVKGVDETYDSTSRGASNSVATTDRFAGQRMSHLGAQLDLPVWRNQLWQFGTDFRRETLRQTNNGVDELLGGKVERDSQELFVQNDIFLGERTELVLGLRWQDDSDFGSHVAPKIAIRHELASSSAWTTSLRGSIGEGYRVPNLKERHFLFDHSALGYVVLGNPDLVPESSTSYQLGAVFARGDDLRIELNAFHNEIDDLIQIDSNPSGNVNGVQAYRYRNVSQARTSGLETGVTWRASPSLSVNAAYTYTQTRDVGTGLELTRRPRSVARLGVDWRFAERTVLATRVRYQSSELSSSDTGARSPAWASVDLSLTHEFRGGLAGFFSIRNLFDKQRDFTDPADFGPRSGRLVMLGLRYRFGDAAAPR
ncbi:MAG: TonB-dependent receptor [Pseudomonadota bacterium]|nr:TonB-dependent receptor [Pseudomonadota bacterium]